MESKHVPDQAWEMIQNRLGYTDEELELFKKNPRNLTVMEAALEMQKKTIVFEVVESHGCNSQHKAGTRFFFSGDGNLIKGHVPKGPDMPGAAANGIQIEYDTIGDRSSRPLLLISGLGCQLICWDDRLCAQMAEMGFYVIRFDNRDTGLSTKFEAAGQNGVKRLHDIRVEGKRLNLLIPSMTWPVTQLDCLMRCISIKPISAGCRWEPPLPRAWLSDTPNGC